MKKKTKIIQREAIPILSEINPSNTVNLNELCSRKRGLHLVKKRRLFAWYCKDQYTDHAIKQFLNLNSLAAVHRLIRGYKLEIKLNRKFK